MLSIEHCKSRMDDKLEAFQKDLLEGGAMNTHQPLSVVPPDVDTNPTGVVVSKKGKPIPAELYRKAQGKK